MIDSHNTKPWFRDEIIRILIGINLSSKASKGQEHDADEFRRGFVLALASIAIVIGIQPGLVLQADDLGLLEAKSGGDPKP